ncbi:uncharacterized protein I206_100870 [Kwoniella pini CBS 10737]|uniref:F-box domain-containing protein n=1 Tax=Kwoniella pini CBS 10737 TaxID=1296096 RepID=A0A1B9IBX7_9TREE|nr:uncharacterized protein I206_00456 [Kwoniella pini CBS 10737]OCF53155.1 hypothetical protein I206_00456 [Kwoniella pini CBS 10737]
MTPTDLMTISNLPEDVRYQILKYLPILCPTTILRLSKDHYKSIIPSLYTKITSSPAVIEGLHYNRQPTGDGPSGSRFLFYGRKAQALSHVRYLDISDLSILKWNISPLDTMDDGVNGEEHRGSSYEVTTLFNSVRKVKLSQEVMQWLLPLRIRDLPIRRGLEQLKPRNNNRNRQETWDLLSCLIGCGMELDIDINWSRVYMYQLDHLYELISQYLKPSNITIRMDIYFIAPFLNQLALLAPISFILDFPDRDYTDGQKQDIQQSRLSFLLNRILFYHSPSYHLIQIWMENANLYIPLLKQEFALSETHKIQNLEDILIIHDIENKNEDADYDGPFPR